MTLLLRPDGMGDERLHLAWRSSTRHEHLDDARHQFGVIAPGLSWGESDDRLSFFGIVTDENVGELVEALDRAASRLGAIDVDVTGLDDICGRGVSALVAWYRRRPAGAVFTAPDHLERLVRGYAGAA